MDLSHILHELGEERSEYFHAVAPPIIQTSNFAFTSFEHFRSAINSEESSYIYSRGTNPTLTILRQKLAALDGAEDALLFNSGASAIYCSVMANVKSGDHIISVAKPYFWAEKLFDIILPRFGVTTTYIDGTDIANFEKAIRSETKIIYLETPNTLTFELQDLKAVAELAQKHEILTIVDNSYCTPLYQKPLELGIDLSLQSATKYIGGHSDVIAGVLTGKKELLKRIFNEQLMNTGSGLPPFHAWLLLRGLRTLPMRLERVSKTTKEVFEWLKKQPQVQKVIFPFDPDFQQYDLAKKQMKDAFGLLTILLKTKSQNEIEKFTFSLKHFLMAVSWGGHESLILPQAASLSAEQFDPENERNRLIRIYIGLEDADYLIKDLEQALAILNS